MDSCGSPLSGGGRMLSRLALFGCLLFSTLAVAAPAALASFDPGGGSSYSPLIELKERARLSLAAGVRAAAAAPLVAENFEVLGHTDLGATDTNGDVWVHGDAAFVGTWSDPCSGLGVKVIDVSDLTAPTLLGRIAGRPGTSAEDVVVRHVSTAFFTGDLAAVGIQRCGDDPALDTQQFGVELWNVTMPSAPVKLGELGVRNGGGGVHELDLFQRGANVYALLATPFSEFFDPVPGGDFRIVDATNPAAPVQVGEFGAAAHGLTPGPFFGMGSFGATFDHSARASADAMRAYLSYWDLGVLTLDISDVTNPVLVSRTEYPRFADGDSHSVSEYQGTGRLFLLQNDEDPDPWSIARIRFEDGRGNATESPGGTRLFLETGHRVRAGVVEARNQGCLPSDYPRRTKGRIAVVRTPFPFFDPSFVPGVTEEPLCLQQDQEAAAEAAGAVAVVHDFIADATSPQWFDFGEVGIPVLFTDHETAQDMVEAGRATLRARRPSWGFLRVFDAESGRQVAKFDDLPHVHELPAPLGFFSIHNNEVVGDRSYASWYTHGIVALDLSLLNESDPDDPEMVGQFVPEGAPSPTPLNPDNVPIVWGVAVRAEDNVIFASDMSSGLWIVRPTGPAAP